MLVVVIVLIAAGVAIPKFSGTFESYQLTDAIRSTVRMARYARTTAIIQQKPCALKFDDHQLVLLSGTNGMEPSTVRKIVESIQIDSFETLTENNQKNEELRKVNFYPAGMNDGFKLTLRTEKNQRATIVCNPISGKITVLEEGQ